MLHEQMTFSNYKKGNFYLFKEYNKYLFLLLPYVVIDYTLSRLFIYFKILLVFF